jgi:hypothetical protein
MCALHQDFLCRYGNFIRADPQAYPQGTEEVVFELCREIGTNKNAEDNLDCAGGIKETAVGIEMDVSYRMCICMQMRVCPCLCTRICACMRACVRTYVRTFVLDTAMYVCFTLLTSEWLLGSMHSGLMAPTSTPTHPSRTGVYTG